MVNTQFYTKIKCISFDNDNEFILKYFITQVASFIKFHMLLLHIKMELLERKNQHILGITKAFLFQEHIPK